MTKIELIELSKETLEILKNKKYLNDNYKLVNMTEDIDKMMKSFEIIRPEDEIKEYDEIKSVNYNIKVTDMRTLDASYDYYKNNTGKVGLLNFASARNPGGGFISGSNTQEESIARSSAMYLTLDNDISKEMYNYNRSRKTLMYSDYMIVSDNVPIFRDSKYNLLDNYYLATIITSPAINLSKFRKDETNDISLKEDKNMIMKRRIERIIKLFIEYNIDNLVLGAFGCGVFKNDPEDVSEYFYEILVKKGFYKKFKSINFAIPKGKVSNKNDNYTIFRDKFDKPI